MLQRSNSSDGLDGIERAYPAVLRLAVLWTVSRTMSGGLLRAAGRWWPVEIEMGGRVTSMLPTTLCQLRALNQDAAHGGDEAACSIAPQEDGWRHTIFILIVSHLYRPFRHRRYDAFCPIETGNAEPGL